jgi:Leucine Rich repeat
MPQLQSLDCVFSNLRAEGVRPFQPALRANRTLKQLVLSCCGLGDDGIRLLAEALARNPIMDLLDVSEMKLPQMDWMISHGCSSRRNSKRSTFGTTYSFTAIKTPPSTFSLHYNRKSQVYKNYRDCSPATSVEAMSTKSPP